MNRTILSTIGTMEPRLHFVFLGKFDITFDSIVYTVSNFFFFPELLSNYSIICGGLIIPFFKKKKILIY